MTQPYSLTKTRTSLVGAAVLAGVFTLDLLFGLWARVPFGGALGLFWTLVTLIGSPIGAYRGSLALGLTKGAILGLTLLAFLPPIGLLVHIVLLTRLPKQ